MDRIHKDLIKNELKFLVVDDERLARIRAVKLLQEIVPNSIIREANSGKQAVEEIDSWVPDIVLLDIQMTDYTGFDVLQQINKNNVPVFLFITAFDSHAVKAFDVNAIDFLLKPYKKERFKRAIEKATQFLVRNKKGELQKKLQEVMELMAISDKDLNKSLDKISIKIGKKYYFVNVSDIKYINSSAYYAEIFTGDGHKHIYRTSLSDLAEKLPEDQFIRINRSTIIRISRIREIVSEAPGDYSVIMVDGQSFSLTKNYKKDFVDRINFK